MSDEVQQQRQIEHVRQRTERLAEERQRRSTDRELMEKASKEIPAVRKEFVKFIKENRECQDNMILLVGSPGVGKSAFINSWAAAMYGKWAPVAKEGCFHPDVRAHVTMRCTNYLHNKRRALRETEDCVPLTHQSDASGLQKEPLLNFRDFAGFSNMDSKSNRIILRTLINKAMPVDMTSFQIDELCQKADLTSLEKLIPPHLNDLNTHRVFVFWAANQPVPTNLLKNVVSVVSPIGVQEGGIRFNRDIRVIGIITKTDLVDTQDEEYIKDKQLFMSYLGLQENLVFEVVNYNPEYTPNCDSENDPRIDLKFLKLMRRVMNPALAPSSVSDEVVRDTAAAQVMRGQPRREPWLAAWFLPNHVMYTLALLVFIIALLYTNFLSEAPYILGALAIVFFPFVNRIVGEILRVLQ